jgi:hypothetical protein
MLLLSNLVWSVWKPKADLLNISRQNNFFISYAHLLMSERLYLVPV